MGRKAPNHIQKPKMKAEKGKMKPQKAKRKDLPPRGGRTRQRVSDCGLKVFSFGRENKRTLAAWPSVVWGAQGPKSTILQRHHPLFSPRAGVCPCRISSGCWPPWIWVGNGLSRPGKEFGFRFFVFEICF